MKVKRINFSHLEHHLGDQMIFYKKAWQNIENIVNFEGYKIEL
jgi:hypothetical protein